MIESLLYCQYNKGMNIIYLDYAATTPAHPLVIKAFKQSVTKYPGNPNSGHALGQMAKQAIDKSLARMRKSLCLSSKYILTPTSGASEANNLAIKGVALSYSQQQKHIITTSFEHSSVTACANYLAKQGYRIDIAPNDEYGRVDVALLESMISKETLLISICSINSEIGIHQPINEIKSMLKRHPHVLLHVDATQSIGKETIELEGIDLISLTAHKFFGIKGIGLLITHPRVTITPLIHGGHSTTLLRRGTPATELIISMEKALTFTLKHQDRSYAHVKMINDYARNLLSEIPAITFNSRPDDLPHILNFSLIGNSSREIVSFLSKRNICISNHTACESEIDLSLGVLALTDDRARATSSVRLSFSYLTTSEEIDTLIEAIKEYVS